MSSNSNKPAGNSAGEKNAPSQQQGVLERAIDRLEKSRDSKASARAQGDLRGQKARGWTEKMLTRVLSGAIYAVVILACLFLGVIPTAIVVSAMAWMCCSEFFRMARMSGRMPNEILGLLAAIAFPLVTLVPAGDTATLCALFALVVACACWYVITPRANLADVATTAFGPIYTSLTFACIVQIRQSDPGWLGGLLTLGVLGSIWLSDSGAYFVGSRFGRHKLAPKISPNKSIEGFWGGLAFCVLIWLVLCALGFWHMPWWLAVLGGLLVGTTSVVGDLFESRIKRGVGVKDSGNVMPGHGGMLDRSDSIIFGGVVAFLLLRIGGIL